MDRIRLCLAIVTFALCFMVGVPTASANGFGSRLQALRGAQQQRQHHRQVQAFVVRQQAFVHRQAFVVAPVITSVPQAFIVPQPQAIIVQQPPAAIVVPQAFSVQSFQAY